MQNWSLLLIGLKKYQVLSISLHYTVKPVHAVTSIKQSSVLKGHLCPDIKKIIWIEPLLGGRLSNKATFSLSQSDLLIQVWL